MLALLERRWAVEARIGAQLDAELGAFVFLPPSPRVPGTGATLRACGLEALPRRKTSVEGELDLERVSDRLEAWVPFDPWFVAFARDPYGNSYGFFCHPPAIERGLGAPVVRFEHESHGLEWVAADWTSFVTRADDEDGAAKRALLRLLSFELPRGWRVALAEERMAAQVAVDMERPIGRSKVAAMERVVALAASWGWPEPLVARARAQLGVLEEELAFERRAHPLRLRAWLAHPDVFEHELATLRAPPDER